MDTDTIAQQQARDVYASRRIDTIRYLDVEGPEIQRAFAALPTPPTADPCAACCPCCGECWQYMGSVGSGVTSMHQFRHRHHPVKGQRWYINVPAVAS